jgi:hypothetical protein
MSLDIVQYQIIQTGHTRKMSRVATRPAVTLALLWNHSPLGLYVFIKITYL